MIAWIISHKYLIINILNDKITDETTCGRQKSYLEAVERKVLRDLVVEISGVRRTTKGSNQDVPSGALGSGCLSVFGKWRGTVWRDLVASAVLNRPPLAVENIRRLLLHARSFPSPPQATPPARSAEDSRRYRPSAPVLRPLLLSPRLHHFAKNGDAPSVHSLELLDFTLASLFDGMRCGPRSVAKRQSSNK